MSTVPHDSLFYRTFSKKENVLVELRAVLPPTLFALIRQDSLTFEPSKLMAKDLSLRTCDILYSAEIGGG